MDWTLIMSTGVAGASTLAVFARLHYGFWVRRLGVELDYHERHERRAADGLPYTLLRLPPPLPPATSDPSSADPCSADPCSAAPSSADPNSADPSSADPSSADPSSADPSSADPSSAAPSSADPSSADPSSTPPSPAPLSAALPPILLVHGIASSHRNVDAEADRSLARYLQAEGRDVWLLTLRSGHSSLRPRERRRVDFRSMVEHDLPEALAFVLAQTGAPALDYVGFSMGGILIYAALGRTIEPSHVRRVATIGSPARVAPPLQALRRLNFLPRFVLRVTWLRVLARMGAFAVEAITTPLHHQVYNPANVDPGAARRAMVNLIEDVPAPLSADFAKWALGDGVVRVHDEDVIARLPGLRVPVIFFAGVVDRIAAPAAVRAAFEAWGTDANADADADTVDKRFVLMGQAHGCVHDYGHGDLAIGERVGVELFAPLTAFLADGD